MWRLLFCVLLGIALLPGIAPAVQAQDAPLVVFIDDKALSTPTADGEGAEGLNQLAAIFRNLGAEVEWRALNDPLPTEAHVIVLARPLKKLPGHKLARLWLHIVRGNHLLLALDPPGLSSLQGEKAQKVETETAGTGLPLMLAFYFGTSPTDDLLAEPWFTTDSIPDQTTAFLRTQAENLLPHAITEPLRLYDLPVLVWGARSVEVEAFPFEGEALPLLYTETAFGEDTSALYHRNEEQRVPLEFNTGQDAQGRLFVGSWGQNDTSGARMALFGDSELLADDYGLALDPATGQPAHWGNYLLMQRTAAWLLDLPTDQWPTMPPGYTQLAVDGSDADWVFRVPLAEDGAGDTSLDAYDIRQVRAFWDDSYLYVLVETAAPPNDGVQLTLGIENTFDGVVDLTLDAMRERVMIANYGTRVPDAKLALGNWLELRAPVRALGAGALISSLCLSDPIRTETLDCLDEPLGLIPVEGSRPPVSAAHHAPLALGLEPTHIYEIPAANAAILENIAQGEVVAVYGRTPADDWLQVQNARVTGWVPAAQMVANIALSNLPAQSPAGYTPPTATPPAAAPGGTATGNTHVIQQGETMFSISQDYGITVDALAGANGISDPNIIVVGQTLVIP